MLNEIRKEYVENRSKGIECDLETMVKEKANSLTRKQLEDVLRQKEIYFKANSQKEILVEYAYKNVLIGLSYQILMMVDIDESLDEFYSRLLKRFY